MLAKLGRQARRGSPPRPAGLPRRATDGAKDRILLNFFDGFTVPGVEHVVLYHDDQDDHLFYMVPEAPSILRGVDDVAEFSLIAFARDFTLLASSAQELPTGETEGGLLGMTTALTVSQEDQAKIREHLQHDAGDKSRVRFRPMLIDKAVRLAPMKAFTKPITLAYPTYVDGSVSFNLFPGDMPTFLKARAGSDKPSLGGSNLASYTALLGQEGVRLIRSAVEQGWSPGTVNYAVKFVARIPNLHIHVYGNASDIYKEIKQHCKVTETHSNGNSYSTYSYPQVSSLEQMRTMVTSLKIEIDTGDFTAQTADPAAAQSVTKQIETMALSLIQTQVMTKFFAPGFTPGLDATKLGTDPFLNNPSGRPMPAGNQLWLKNFSQEMEGSIDFTVDAKSNITVDRYPNSQLFALISPEEIKKTIHEADLSQPIFNLLDVPVRVTANFDTDPVAAIQVNLAYDEKDDKTGEAKTRRDSFTFQKGDEVFHFRSVMAKDSEGRPKDTYRYSSKLVYKASAKSEEVPEQQTTDRNLILGYDKLGCVQVAAVLGAVPLDSVSRVQIHFRYPDANLPTAEQDVFLDAASPQSSWFTYTGGNPSREYEYTTTFFMADGQQVALPVQRSISDRLVINAPFQDRLSATFVPQGSFPTVSSIVVSTRYKDAANGYDVDDVHTFTAATDTWKWEFPLRDKALREFEYKVDVTFADGSSASGDWQKGVEGTILVGQVTRELLAIEVVSTLVDFAKWKLVIVRLRYADPANKIDVGHDVKLTAAGPDPADGLKWTVPIKDPAQKTFTYQVQAFGVDGTTKQEVPLTSTTDPLVLLQI
jgi:hypothetical protein